MKLDALASVLFYGFVASCYFRVGDLRFSDGPAAELLVGWAYAHERVGSSTAAVLAVSSVCIGKRLYLRRPEIAQQAQQL